MSTFFDAIAGAAATDLEDGTIFDLALAPPAFSSSPRIRAQQACLMYANSEVDGGDLSSLLVPGTPLTVAWPLEGCPALERSTKGLSRPHATTSGTQGSCRLR